MKAPNFSDQQPLSKIVLLEIQFSKFKIYIKKLWSFPTEMPLFMERLALQVDCQQ